MAAIRNTATGLMRLHGQKNFAATTRRYAAWSIIKPWLFLAFLRPF
jgi:hypothetical protein